MRQFVDGGCLILPSKALPTALQADGPPALVVSDAQWLPSYPSTIDKDGTDTEEDQHIIRVQPCRDGVWTSCLVNGKTLLLLNLAGLKSNAEDELTVSEKFIDQLEWEPLEEHLAIDHGNAFVFTESSFPSDELSRWFDNWNGRAFELTQSVPINVTGDVPGPVGVYWNISSDEEESVRLSLSVIKADGVTVAIKLEQL